MYFEAKIARFRRTAVRLPYEVVQAYCRLTAADHLLHFCCESRTIFGDHKAAERQINDRTNFQVDPPGEPVNLPCEGNTADA